MKSVLFWGLLILGAAWAGTALWVQFPSARWVVGLFVLAVAGVIWLRLLSSGWGWAGLGLLSALLAVWYLTLTPRQDRDWAPDVARIVHGEVAGDQVTLHNLRAFRWQTRDTAEQTWQSGVYDLRQLTGADMITSVWSSPDIAHLLVSFGFADGRHVVFSVEIRREADEKFSSLGGFFRQFELALVAADEADIVKLRSNFRGEDVRLYPLHLTPEQLRAVFLRYVDLGNELNRAPRFYNTITSNCTTVVWHLVKVLKPDLGLDPSLLLSGRLPDWLHRLGVLEGSGSLADIREQARISTRAQAAPAEADFSAWIRETGRPAP